MKLTDAVATLKGIGPRKARALGQLDIHTIGDLLNHYPSRVEFPPEPADIKGVLEPGNTATVVGTVDFVIGSPRDKAFACTVRSDRSETFGVRWFNMGRYLRSLNVQKGTGIMLFGKYKGPGCWNDFENPEFKVFPASKRPDLSGLRVVTYPVASGITSREISRYVKQALPLASLNVRLIHDPKDQVQYETALKEEKYNELFYMQLALAVQHHRRREAEPNVQCIPTPKAIEGYFPFEFTGDQRQAVWDIHGDICSDHAMNRLLQGDVGSGKTAVAAYAAMMMACNGGQTAILCPTQVLAEQHYWSLKKLFEGAGLQVCLSTGGNVSYRNYSISDVVIGTTALLAEDTKFRNLGLVVIDEQHKFGVEQRAELAKHGNPHMLLMTATPIPRTIAMTAFGDLDVSIIKEMPPGRTPVETCWFQSMPPGNHADDIILHELSRGNQVYVVCPRIEAIDDEMRAVEEVYQEYCRKFGAIASIGVLHGKMSKDSKQLTQQWWNCPSTTGKILVATTVVEVGVDNPNATVMVIEGAERFGLAQLHQLRGRVGRSNKKSYCFLLSDTDSGDGRARLKAMERTNDGFEIAEQDIKLRGPGDLLSTRQHGLPELKIADLVEDFDLMVAARAKAQALVALGSEAFMYSRHMDELKRRHGDVLHLGDVG